MSVTQRRVRSGGGKVFSRWRMAAVLFIAGLLTACGPAPTPPPVAVAPVAEAPKAAQLTLTGAAGDSFQSRPSLRLAFDRPLASGQPFDDLVQVVDANGARPDGSWQYEQDGNVLRFPYIGANRTYTVTVAAALAAADGTTLGAPQSREVFSGNLPPLLAFASTGSVLRSGDEAGLPVIAVNAPEADIEFFRVAPERYSAFFAQWRGSGERGYWELQDIAGLGSSVYSNRYQLEGAPNERQINHIPVQTIAELREPGLFIAVMKRPGDFQGQFATTHFFVTDIGLHARSYTSSLWVHAASLASGQPRSGVALELRDEKGALLAETQTGGDGSAAFAVKVRPEHVLVARAGSELAVLSFRQPALDLAEFAVAGRPQRERDAFIWSARDLYRPGETLEVSALLRNFDGKLVGEAGPLFAVLRQPDGRTLSARLLEPSELASYALVFPIDADAPTGRWNLGLYADPEAKQSVGSWDFRVEEFLPERMKLQLDAPERALAPGEALALGMQGDYLYGAPAAGNRVKVELIYRPAIHAIAAHKDFVFADPKAELPKEPQEALDDKLDDRGALNSEIALLDDATVRAQPVELRVAASLFESGGRAIRRSLVRTVLPAEQVVGVRPLFDPDSGAAVNEVAKFEVIRSDAAGALSAAELSGRLVREHRDYHWTFSEQGGWSADYVEREEVIEEFTLALDGQRPALREARVEWGEYRLELTDPATGLTMRYPFRAGWSWSDDNRGSEPRPDKVRLALDKTGYRAGDTLTVTLTPPHEGPALLLVETDELLSVQTLQARAGTEVSLAVDERWERHDVYLTALVFRPGSSNEPASPPRAVGIAHVPMRRDDRSLAVALEAPELVRPNEELVVKLNAPELAGQTAFAQLDAVDQGVLALTGYGVPDAAAHFFAQRGLTTEARDLYGRLIERLAGSRARLRYGGDAALAALPQARRPTAQVKTAALHAGPVAFDAEGRAEVRFTAPEFNGALRLAALAYSADTYGKGSGESLVRAPLVVEASTPRVMAPRDRAQLAVDLHNLSGSEAAVEVRVSASDLLRVEAAPLRITLADNARRTLSLPITALPGQGLGRFRIEVEGAGIKWARDYELVVRSPWPSERAGRLQEVTAPADIALGRGVLDGLDAAGSQVRVAISTTPPIPLGSAIDGLIGYPHGCIEQTSSRLWPLVWADEAVRTRLGIDLSEDERQKRLRAGFDRITSMQLASGQFGYWPGDSYANPQMTAYVAELLLTARDAGISIPQIVLDKALERLNEDLLSGGDGFYSYEHSGHLRFASLAHAGYVLARAGKAPLGALRALHDHERSNSLTALPLLHLGIALQLQGDGQRAKVALDEAQAKTPQRPDYLGDYGSRLRDEALAGALLYEHELADRVEEAKLLEVAREVRNPDAQRYGLSTQEQLAVFRLGRQLLAREAASLAGRWRIGGSDEALPTASLSERRFAGDVDGARLVLEGSGRYWLLEDAVGSPRSAPPPQDNGLRVRRSWFRMDGKRFEGETLREGDTLLVQLTVEANENVPDAIVTDLLPGGLEVENLGLGDRGTLESLVIDGTTLSERHWAAEVQHEEYRDDRYVAAVKLWGGQTAKLFYLVRAVSPGRYVNPPSFAEDMYRPRIRSIGGAMPAMIEVKAADAP